jgi:hypothetical protein
MSDVFAAAVELQQFVQRQSWSFCIIGGLALARWGQPRATGDVDVTLLTGFGDETKYVDVLLGHFQPRIADARRFSLESRVLLLKASNGVGLDVAMGGLPFEEALVQRSTEFDFGHGVQLVTASAEDLIVLKAFAGRPQDWVDVSGILTRQAGKLNWQQILEDLSPLCELKDSPETLQRLNQMRDELATE